jgi:excisionase family DNA binding protein
MRAKTDSQWLTVKEVAEYLRVSTDLIYRLAQEGKMPASKVGGRWRFKKEKVDKWMDEQHSGPVRGKTRRTADGKVNVGKQERYGHE